MEYSSSLSHLNDDRKDDESMSWLQLDPPPNYNEGQQICYKVLSPPTSLMPELNPPSPLQEQPVKRKREVIGDTITGFTALCGEVYSVTLEKSISGGLGLTLAALDNAVKITDVAYNSAAIGSGIRVGDVMIAVQNISVIGIPFSEVISRLKSIVGEAILRLRREGRPVLTHSGQKTACEIKRRYRPGPYSMPASSILSHPADRSDKKNSYLSSASLQMYDIKEEQGRSLLSSDAIIQEHATSDMHDRGKENVIDISNRSRLLAFAHISESAALREPLTVWEVKLCTNDRDRYKEECHRKERQLELCSTVQGAERQRFSTILNQLETVMTSSKTELMQQLQVVCDSNEHLEPYSKMGKMQNELDTLRRRVFASQAKIQEYEIREARRAAENALQSTREHQHAFSESERVKMCIVHALQSHIRSSPAVHGVGTLAHVRLDGVTTFVCDFVFPKDLIMSAASNNRCLTRHWGVIRDFQLDYETAAALLGWNFCESIRCGVTGYFVNLHDRFDVYYDSTREMLKIECSFFYEPVGP